MMWTDAKEKQEIAATMRENVLEVVVYPEIAFSSTEISVEEK